MSYLRSLREKPGALNRGRVRTASRTAKAGISLAKRRRWYADGDDTTEDDEGQSGTDDSDAAGESGESDEEETVPELLQKLRAGEVSADEAYAIIAGLRHESADGRQAKKDLATLKEAQEAAKRKSAEEQGKFQELWEGAQDDLAELKALRDANATRLEQLKTRNEARIVELPKDKQQTAREIIETAGTDDPDKVAGLLDKLIPTLGTGATPPPNDGGNKGDSRKQAGKAAVKLNKVSF